MAVTILASFLVMPTGGAAAQEPTQIVATLLSASFDGNSQGFVYADDPFGTAQSNYASGSWQSGGGYSGGGLFVSVGGVNDNVISNMSGGWKYTLNLASEVTGVLLTFRYRMTTPTYYEYDEYSRVLVKVDETQYGRGAKPYVDHIGGDGNDTGPATHDTLWQLHQVYLGTLPAGAHTLILGAYNNHKSLTNEVTSAYFDDVLVTSGNAAPAASDAQQLVNRVDINQFLGYIQGVAQFDDRCRGPNMSCSSSDYSTNYYNAMAWLEGQLQGLGYTTTRHNFSYNGNTGTNLWATKVGSVTPTEMYMISTHLDGRGGGDAFNDDGSGVGLVMEIARVLAGSDVTTGKSVRFLFWDKEELGLYGSRGYVQDRQALQGTLNEPTWLGLITHDMILYDHGVGSVTTQQSPYADLDVEWRDGTTYASQSMALALAWRFANGTYSTDYPANAANYSTNTDDTPFHNYCPSISVRENRRGVSGEWINPYYHTVNDKETSYTRDDDADGKRDDIELGYNAVQATLATIAELAGAHIASANNPPVADPQSATTPEDTPVALTLTGSDPDGDPITFQVTGGPSHGTLNGTAPYLTYAPAADYNGEDSFTFVVNDGRASSAPGTVSLSVTPVNDPPSANPQSVATQQDTSVGITLTGTDVDGDILTYLVATPPLHGSLVGEAPDLTYTPDLGYLGPDGFTFTVSDGVVPSDPATIDITVTAVNHAPVADPQSATTAEDVPLAITLTGSDPDGDPLTFVVADGPDHGTLSGTAPSLTYTPASNYFGPDTFGFVASDGQLTSPAAAVEISVNPVNDAPVASAQSVTTQQDAPVAITLTGSDVDGDSLTYSIVTEPGHGTLSGAAPSLTYTPAAGYSGSDSFTFEVSDGQLSSAQATVSVTVNANGPLLYLGSSTSGTAGGVSFADEDILIKNQSTGAWSLYIDGSDIGLSSYDVDAFDLQADGSLLVSFDVAFTLSGFAAVDDSDILRFVPSSTGPTTAGTWQWYFDGSDVGLSTSDEDVDAFHVLPDGRLLISTLGSVSVTGASGADEDLLVFTPTGLGSTTSGTWAMYFDGSDVGLSTTSNEDINGAWVDAAGKIYLTTVGSFSVTGVTGDGSDIFVCTPRSLGSATSCTWAMYWDGSSNGFYGEDTDSLGIVE